MIVYHVNIYAVDIDADIEYVELSNNKGYAVTAHNREFFPVYIYIDFSLVSYTSSVELPAIIKLMPGTTDAILQLHRVENQRRFSYSVTYSFMFDNPNTTLPDNYLYFFPFDMVQHIE